MREYTDIKDIIESSLFNKIDETILIENNAVFVSFYFTTQAGQSEFDKF